jgi:hypothetical protein
MGYKYTKGVPVAVGFDVQVSRPIDERSVVDVKDDLKTIPNTYGGIIVSVADEQYKTYIWNGLNQTDLANWNEYKGAKGDQGVPGSQGVHGPRGLTGDKGLKGDKGDPGNPGQDGQEPDHYQLERELADDQRRRGREHHRQGQSDH